MDRRLSLLLFLLSLLILSLLSSPLLSAPMYRVKEGVVDCLSLEVHMVGGYLSFQGGADDILWSHFITSNPHWIPEIDFLIEEDRGFLEIRQSITLRGLSLSSPTNEWEIRVGDKIPLYLDVVMGAAVGDIDLSGTSIEDFTLKTGIGDVKVDVRHTSSLRTLNVQVGVGSLILHLDSIREEDLHVELSGGVGKATIYLPWDLGVKVHVQGGLGRIKPQGFLVHDTTYVNEAYGKTDISIYIELWAGLGEIHLIQEFKEDRYTIAPFMVELSRM